MANLQADTHVSCAQNAAGRLRLKYTNFHSAAGRAERQLFMGFSAKDNQPW